MSEYKQPTERRDIFAEGVAENLVTFTNDGKSVRYVEQNLTRNFKNPEEPVQAETYIKLIQDYGYAASHIKLYPTVTIGSSKKEADIIVRNEDGSAHIVVECKEPDVSELEFQQAVKQAQSYAATGTVRAKYIWVTSGIKNQYYEIPDKEPKHLKPIPDIPQHGVKHIARHKYANGGGEINGQKFFPLDIITEDELTRRFKLAHNALWGGGQLDPSDAFDELDKLIFCKIWDENETLPGEAYKFQIFTESTEEKTNQTLYNNIKKLYEHGKKADPEVFKEDVRLSPEKLRTVVGYIESVNLSETDLDCKGRAFETFMGSFFRGDFGQYFTPRPIVDFIVDVLPIDRHSRVLDTSCGSGGFLLYALRKIRGQADGHFPRHKSNAGEATRHYTYWHDFAQNKLFGIEVNEQIARTAKMNMIIHDDGHTNVVSADGLQSAADLRDRTKNPQFKADSFDFIITNPPFGSLIKQTEQAYMQNYGFAYKEVDWLNPKDKKEERGSQLSEILFIEQCHNYLRAGGYLAIVIPDGILTNSSLQYVRDSIAEKFRIVAVVSMPQTAFQATGAGVKSSVLFLKKHTPEVTENVAGKKEALQADIKEKYNYEQQLRDFAAEEKQLLKITGSKDGKKALKEEYKRKINAIKEKMADEYAARLPALSDDYAIFMAIAEDIGYDATGRKTAVNELDIVGKELKRFIHSIEEDAS